MANYNEWRALGRLTGKPQTKEIGSNTVTEFSVACNKAWKDKDDNWKEKVSFINCQQFGQYGKSTEIKCDKGMEVLVEGELMQDRWEDKETGVKRDKHYVVVKKLSIISDPIRKKNEEQEELPVKKEENDDVPF